MFWLLHTFLLCAKSVCGLAILHFPYIRCTNATKITCSIGAVVSLYYLFKASYKKPPSTEKAYKAFTLKLPRLTSQPQKNAFECNCHIVKNNPNYRVELNLFELCGRANIRVRVILVKLMHGNYHLIGTYYMAS